MKSISTSAINSLFKANGPHRILVAGLSPIGAYAGERTTGNQTLKTSNFIFGEKHVSQSITPVIGPIVPEGQLLDEEPGYHLPN